MAHESPPDWRAQDAEAAAWLYRNSDNGVAVLRDGRIVSINPAWSRISGYAAEQIIGQHALKTIHPEDRKTYFEAAERLKTVGEVEFENRVVTGDGRTIWVRLAVKRTSDDLYMAVMKDITTEHQRREEEEYAQRMGDLIRSSAQVYTWRYNSETASYLSDRAPRVNGEGGLQQEVSAQQMGEEIHPDDRERMDRAIRLTLKTGEVQSIWYRHLQEDGAYARYRSTWRGGRILSNGRYEILGLTQDMTELAEARDAALAGEQAAKEAAETKSRFLANMSHEIRTPLNGVLGVLHLLRNENLSENAAALVAEALGCGVMLTQILNDVLDFSKIEAGKLELNPEPVDPVEAVNGVADMLRSSTEGRGLYLSVRFEGHAGWVSVDPVRLRQVLFNLIGNAAKFTLRGGVEITLASIGEGPDHRLKVSVKDTGVGIAPEAMSALFERFHQVDGSTTRQFGGTGLGLAITRSLVEQMGGEVQAESIPGQGSTFWFEIAAPQVQAVVAASTDDGDWLEGLRVLVVEDNATNRLIASRMLESLGASVELANDGVEGVEAAGRCAYDLIFMDIQMPVMDGVEATRRIRKIDGPAATTPIVAMTANVMKHQISEYLAAGMDGAVAKPLSPSAILAELARLAGAGEEQPLDAVA